MHGPSKIRAIWSSHAATDLRRLPEQLRRFGERTPPFDYQRKVVPDIRAIVCTPEFLVKRQCLSENGLGLAVLVLPIKVLAKISHRLNTQRFRCGERTLAGGKHLAQ